MPNRKCDPAPSLDEKAPVCFDGLRDDEGVLIGLKQEIALAAEGSRLTGIFQTYRQMNRLTKLQETYILSEIKKSKAFRHQVYVDEGGNRIETTTWALYCKHFVGRPTSSVDEEILNLRGLGIEVFQTAEKAGIPMSKLTGIRLLSDASREGVLEAINNRREDPEEVREIVRAAIEQHEFEKTEIQIKLDEAQADIKAKDRVIEDKSTLLDEKNRELDEQRLIKDRETLTEEEKKQLLRKTVMDKAACVVSAIIYYNSALDELHEAGMDTVSTPEITRAQLDAMFEQLEWTREKNGCGSHRQFFIPPDMRVKPLEFEPVGGQEPSQSEADTSNVIPLGAAGPDDQEA